MKSETEPCKSCYLSEICNIKDPVGINGKVPISGTNCVHYTCGVDGEQSARIAWSSKLFQPLNLVSGEVTFGVRFGSDGKPTHISRNFERYVTPGGEIISKIEDGYVRTGQVIPVWEE